MKPLVSFPLSWRRMSYASLLIVGVFLGGPLIGDPKSKGKGGGGGGGPMPEAARETIHALFSGHEKIERKVALTEKGYRATTTSKDPELARKIRAHVAQMETRLDAGYSVRRWDPAFDELRDHYRDMAVSIVEVEGGLSVTVAGKTPEAVKVARNHAQIISGFIEKGFEQAHETHPIALDGKD